MADYIRRDIVLQIINTVHETGGFAGYADYCTLFDEIDTMPAADVQPVKRGEWVGIGKLFSEDWKCSVCGNLHSKANSSNFCSFCGAEMENADATKG